jgi:hypothetical protein
LSLLIDYLNQIKHQGKFLEKLRRLKYLKDHFLIEGETDIKQILTVTHHEADTRQNIY